MAKTELEAAGEDTTGMVESVSKLRDEVKAISGVDILQADQKTFKSTAQIVGELSRVYNSLSDIDQANLLELLGGKRGANVLAAAIQNYDIVEETIKGASEESVGSMDQQLEIYNQSVQASLDKFKVAFQELAVDFLNSDFLKGLIDAGTAIIKIVDELVKRIGSLGTVLTGIGIANLVSTAIKGAGAVEGWGSALSLVFEELASGATTAEERMTAMQIILSALTGKAVGAKSALGGLFTGIGALLSNPVTLGIGATVAAIATVAAVYKKQQDDLRKQATEATNNWNDSSAKLDEYKQKYQELHEQLNDANITESQRIAIKQQLLDLQNEIVSKYGDQVSGIDLVNGKLQTQLGILSNITQEEARRNVQDNKAAYEQSANEMTKQRKYTLSNGNTTGGMAKRVASAEMQKQIDAIYTNADFTKFGETFTFTGDATEFNEAVREVLDGLNDIKDSASESDKVIVQTAINSAQSALNKNNKVLDEYQDNYKAYLEQSLYADGYGDELSEYARRTQAYNEALFSGSTEKIVEAKTQLDDYEGTVDGILGEHPEYGDFFDEISNSVDTTTEAIINFKDIIDDGVAESTNKLGEYEKEIKRTVDSVKAMGLDGVDVQDILLNGGTGFEELSNLAKWFNPDFDVTNAGDLQGFIDMLGQLGVISTGIGDDVDMATASFDDFLKIASSSIETIDKVNGALVNAFASGGLSIGIDQATGELTGDVATIMSAYKNLESYNPQRLFEHTADGIIVNTKALREMRAEQERTMKAQFEDRIKEAQENLNKAIESGNESEISAWKTRLQNVQLLSTAYNGATSAYQKWLDAQNGGEMGDQYDAVVDTALKRGKELYDEGLVGTNEFRAIAQMYSNEDLSTASIDEITEAYENGVDVVKKYFTEGQEGAVAFADKLVDLGEATKDSDGNYDFSQGIDTENLANELGISVDLVEAAFKKLNDYGFDIHFVSPETAEALTDISERANEAQEKLRNLANEEGKIGSLDFSDALNLDIDELDTVEELDDALSKLSQETIDPKVNPAAYEAFSELLSEIQAKRDLLTGDEAEVPLTFDTLSAGFTKMDELQQRISAIGLMNETANVNLDVYGDEQVQQLSEEIAGLPEDLKVSLGFEANDSAEDVVDKLQNKTVTIPVQYQQPSGGIGDTTATVRADFDQSSIQVTDKTVHIEPEPNPVNVNAVATLDSTAVDNYDPKNLERKVTYTKESPTVDSYNPPDHYRSVNYSVDVSNSSAVYNLPGDDDRYITYHVSVTGDTPPAYKGTVSRSAFQGMTRSMGTAHANGVGGISLKHDENALINELGAEIVVRPSTDSWMIFNDGKPTLGAPLKKGDIIFDAVESKKLLERGWADDYAHMLSGSSHVKGTVKGKAHGAIGKGKFNTPTSSSSSKSSNNNDSGGGSDNGGNTTKKSTEAAKDFKEVLDKIEIKLDRIERKIGNLDTVASNVFNGQASRANALSNSLKQVRIEVTKQTQGYKRYLKQANSVKLDSKLKEKVRNGEIGIQDVKDEKTWEKIEEYKKWYELALDCRDAVYQLKADEADLWNQRFDLNQKYYESRIEQYSNMYDALDSYIDIAENTGRISANAYRTRQISEENKKINKLSAEYTSLEKAMNDALASGEITYGSEGYYEMRNALREINGEIVQSKANITELNKSIRETNWDIFDKTAERISNMRDELDFIYGLLGDEDTFYDSKGNVTENGIAGFGVITSQYNIALKEHQKYSNAIKSINKQIAKDPYNQDLLDRRQDLYEADRKAIESANDYKDSIVDLVEKGIKAQIDSMKELIDQYTDLMDSQKDELDYAKKVASAQDNINSLQKQLNAYANDDSEEGRTRRQKLQKSLKDAQDNLAQTEEERRISQTKKLLSDLQDEYETILNARLDDIDALIKAVVDGVDANATTIADAITTATNDVGYMITGDVKTIFADASSGIASLASYFTDGDFVNKVTSIGTSVSNIEQYYKDATTSANNTAKTNIRAEDDKNKATTNEASAASKAGVRAINNANKTTGVSGSWTTKTTGTGKNKKTYRTGWKFNNGTKATGWSQIDKKWYYFDRKGNMKAGLQTINGSKYYLRRNSGRATSEWVKVNNKWYYFDSKGKAVTGWKNLTKDKKKNWYFFDPTTGAMRTNTWIHSGKITTSPKKGDYYVNGSGISVKGKVKIGKKNRTFGTDRRWKGYRGGTKYVGADGMYWTNENVPETIIRKSDGAILTKLNQGDTVFNGDATKTMWDFANNPNKFLKTLGVNNTYGNGNNVNLEFNLSGLRSPTEFFDALRKDKRFEKLVQEMTLGRVNGHGSLAKNAIKF